MEVLVAYATKNGSTEQVARAIAATFQDHGAQVTLLPARKARTPVTGYGLIVLGAPLYSGRWHGDARRFLKRHHRELAAVPAAVFAMGPRNDTEDAWRRSRAQLDRALARYGWLEPVGVTVFGGVDPRKGQPLASPRYIRFICRNRRMSSLPARSRPPTTVPTPATIHHFIMSLFPARCSRATVTRTLKGRGFGCAAWAPSGGQ